MFGIRCQVKQLAEVIEFDLLTMLLQTCLKKVICLFQIYLLLQLNLIEATNNVKKIFCHLYSHVLLFKKP